MSDLNKKYQEVLDELEKNIKDKNALNSVKGKLSELVIFFTDMINKSVDMEKNLEKTEQNIKILKKRIDNIEQDIYIDPEGELENLHEFGIDQMHDNDYEFEITCPYCDYEFITDDSHKNQHSIKCPKCNKIIELDWGVDESCQGDCHSCGSHCYFEDDNSTENEVNVAEDKENYSVDIKPTKENTKKKDKKNNNNNEDDM